MNFKKLSSLVCTAVILMGSFPAWSDMVMGVFPRRPSAETHKSFKPLADKLSKELGKKVTLVVSRNFKEFWKKVKAKQFDIVHYNQYHYIKSHHQFGYKVIATNEEFGSKTIRTQLLVRKDQGLNSVKDLKGKTIVFGGGRKAMVCYIAPKMLLKKAGLLEGRDYKADFAKNPPSAIIATYHKVADATGCGDIILHVNAMVKSRVDASQMMSLAETKPYVHLAWAVKGSLPEAKAKKIQAIMVGLKGSEEGNKILKAAHVTNFHKAVNTDFNIVREMTEYAIGEKL